MATYGWGTNHPLKDALFEEGYRFEFYQAVRLLKKLGWFPVCDEDESQNNPLYFKSNVDLRFPPGDISEIKKSNDETRDSVEMTVNFMGLAGHLGPLPAPYTELIRKRISEKDNALKDFLDIFNHRLIALMYQVRKIHRIGFEILSPDKSHFASYFFSLMGMGTGWLQDRMKFKDRSLLYYTALMAQQPRSMAGLESVLADYFRVKVRGRQLCGQWYDIDKNQVSRIGASGQNSNLGNNTIVGTRIWDQQGKFEIEIGPLRFHQLYDFMPDVGTASESLFGLIRFYAGTNIDYDILLTLRKDEDIRLPLGKRDGPILGRTSWLKRSYPPGPPLKKPGYPLLTRTSWVGRSNRETEYGKVRLSSTS